MRRIVVGAEALAVVAIALFVIMLFANEPDGGGSTSAGGPGTEVYSAECARCHGADGGGGIGPRLSDGAVVDAYPDIAGEIEVVTDGTPGGMPSFEGRLSPEEIEQVVEYTRTL